MKVESLTEEQRREITEALINGQKIQAIKIYREATGLGLKEAKDDVEEFAEVLSKSHPEMKAAKSSGCFSVLLIGICGVGFAVCVSLALF